jgi:hypothetical protein
MQFNFDQVVAHLRKVQTEHGDESFHTSLKGLFRGLIGKPGGEQYIERLLEEFGVTTIDLGTLKAEAKSTVAAVTSNVPPQPSLDVVRHAIEQEMPNCKTQAQFDLVIEAWGALRIHLNSVYGFDQETANKALDGLHQLLSLAPKITALQERLQSSPEATTNRDYVDEPKQLTEHHKQQTLLAELRDISDWTKLQAWYDNTKSIRDSIVNQALRNELLDAVREKKHSVIN